MEHSHDDEIGPRHFFGVVPVFLVDDIEATAIYYRDVLGFDIDFIYGDPPIYASVSRNDAILHFNLSSPLGRRNGVSSAGTGNGVDVMIVVRDLDDLYAELEARGATVLLKPSTQDYGMREFHVEDCNRYRIALTEEIEDEDA